MSIFADPLTGNDSFVNVTSQPIQQTISTQEQPHQNISSQPFVMTSKTQQQQYFEVLNTAATLHQFNSLFPAFNSFERAAAVLNSRLFQMTPSMGDYMSQFSDLYCSPDLTQQKDNFSSGKLKKQVYIFILFM